MVACGDEVVVVSMHNVAVADDVVATNDFMATNVVATVVRATAPVDF